MSFVVPLLLLFIAAACDLRSREIPNWISLAMLGWALTATALGIGALTWPRLAGGLVIGLTLSAPLFYLGGIGGGDVKLVSALGAALGPWPLLTALVWIAVVGGVWAGVAKIRGQQDFAYVPAMFLGLAGFALWSVGWSHV